MFEDFTFAGKKVNPADSTGDTLDLDAHLSPKDVLVPTDRSQSQSQSQYPSQSQSQSHFQNITTPTQAVHHVAATHPATLKPASSIPTRNQVRNHDRQQRSEQIDSLTQQMGQTVLSYYRSGGTLRAVPQFEDPETGYALPMPGLSFNVPIPSSPSSQFSISGRGNCELPYKLIVDSTPQPDVAPIAVPYRRAGCTSRAQYKIPPSRGDAQNTRAVRAELMEKMIKYGVQCKVQPSMPKPPATLGQPTSPSPPYESEGNLDLPMLDADGHSESSEPMEASILANDERTSSSSSSSSSSIGLRQAGMTGRIQYRRAGGNLVCPSAAEVAARSKNLRRSVTRMRRRSSNQQKSAAPTPTLTPTLAPTFAPGPVEPIQLPTPPPEAYATSPTRV